MGRYMRHPWAAFAAAAIVALSINWFGVWGPTGIVVGLYAFFIWHRIKTGEWMKADD